MSYGEKTALSSTRPHACVWVWISQGRLLRLQTVLGVGVIHYTPGPTPPSSDNFGGAVFSFDLGRGPRCSPGAFHMGTGESQASFFFLTHSFFGSRWGEGLIGQLKVADGLETQKWVSKESGEGARWMECVHRCVGVCVWR